MKVSPGGSQIYEYDELEPRDLHLPEQYCVYIDEICAHFDKLHPERRTTVFHEIISDLVHIDVHVMYPNEKEDFYVLYTTGMSDLPMSTPAELDESERWARAELLMYLPKTWNPEADMEQSYADFWPIQTLQFLARFPHEYSTWLAHGHTIPNGPDYAPFLEGSQMSCVALCGFGEPTSPVIANDGSIINIYMITPNNPRQ